MSDEGEQYGGRKARAASASGKKKQRGKPANTKAVKSRRLMGKGKEGKRNG